jgi:hypothetical protein
MMPFLVVVILSGACGWWLHKLMLDGVTNRLGGGNYRHCEYCQYKPDDILPDGNATVTDRFFDTMDDDEGVDLID